MQLGLGLRFWGGARKGAGRKRGRNVPHGARQKQAASAPVLVTLRVSQEVGNLRARFGIIRQSLSAAKERLGVRINQFSVQRDHFHLIVECEDETALSRAMKGLQIRIAKRLNSALRRLGQVFSDRYHARRLNSPREVRNALAYTLLNHRKHNISRNQIDTCSSGHYFNGWKDIQPNPTQPSPVAPAKSYLLAQLWKKYQPLISTKEVPGS